MKATRSCGNNTIHRRALSGRVRRRRRVAARIASLHRAAIRVREHSFEPQMSVRVLIVDAQRGRKRGDLSLQITQILRQSEEHIIVSLRDKIKRVNAGRQRVPIKRLAGHAHLGLKPPIAAPAALFASARPALLHLKKENVAVGGGLGNKTIREGEVVRVVTAQNVARQQHRLLALVVGGDEAAGGRGRPAKRPIPLLPQRLVDVLLCFDSNGVVAIMKRETVGGVFTIFLGIISAALHNALRRSLRRLSPPRRGRPLPPQPTQLRPTPLVAAGNIAAAPAVLKTVIVLLVAKPRRPLHPPPLFADFGVNSGNTHQNTRMRRGGGRGEKGAGNRGRR